MPMVMTVLEARVPRAQWGALEQTHRERMGPERLPPPLVRTLLVQSAGDPEVWQLIALWRSREALEAYRRSVATPGGVVLFRSVGAEPRLAVYDVAQEVAAPAPPAP
jgi:hypothetical protein